MKHLLKIIRKNGKIFAIAGIFAIAIGAQSYAATDGFCTSNPTVSYENSTVIVPAKVVSIKTSILELGKDKSEVKAINGKSQLTYKVTRHCGRQKSKSITNTKVLSPVMPGRLLVGTRHDVTETIAIPFNTVHKSDPNSFEGQSSITTTGVAGSQDITYSVAQDEGQPEVKTAIKTAVKINPVDKVVSDGTKKHEYVQIKTYPVAYPGQYATLTAVSLPGSTCNISVRYSSGYSTAAGLYTKNALGDGSLSWTWKVGTRTYSGDWPINVTCTLYGDSASADSHIIVN